MTGGTYTQQRSRETRQRLLEAATLLFHRQGIASTAFADIAQAAGVPVGNVYYHFRSKDDLIAAVVEYRAQELRQRFGAAGQEPDPLERLKLLVRDGRRNRDDLVAHGCPFAALAQETELAQDRLFEQYLDFATAQFELLGWGAASRELAEEFVASLQGSFLLANGTASGAFLDRQLQRLEGWLDRVGQARSPVAVGRATISPQ